MCLVLICKGCTLLRHSHYDESFDEGGDANDQKTYLCHGRGVIFNKKNNVAEFLNNFLGKNELFQNKAVGQLSHMTGRL